jgi:hypothetical protein
MWVQGNLENYCRQYATWTDSSRWHDEQLPGRQKALQRGFTAGGLDRIFTLFAPQVQD